MNANVEHIADVLKCCGKDTLEQKFSDGTTILVMPYGGRVIGFCSDRNRKNLFWTHPALQTVADAKSFYAQPQWHNTGGDRTWLAPEVDIFFPNFPDLNIYTQPKQIDPGNFKITQTKTGVSLSNKLSVKLSRSQKVIDLVMTKQFGVASNPVPLDGVEYAGFTSTTMLEIINSDKDNCGTVGLWHLMQLPCDGQMIVSTYKKAEPVIVFGEVPECDLSISANQCEYNVTREGSCKFSLDAVDITGRAGYAYGDDKLQTLIIRYFFVNPSGMYIDVPFDDTQRMGLAFQACKINDKQWGSFCELEYHVPAIGSGTGKSECVDMCQTWAFRGAPAKIQKIKNILLASSKI
jgi:hypothetical protein